MFKKGPLEGILGVFWIFLYGMSQGPFDPSQGSFDPSLLLIKKPLKIRIDGINLIAVLN
jgi:hypothetical protein